MNDWLDRLRVIDMPSALISVVRVKGSAPREVGTKMVVAKNSIFGTIGGGHLEYQAIDAARALLTHEKPTSELHDYALGPQLGQCCGGAVTLCIEPVVSRDWIDALAGSPPATGGHPSGPHPAVLITAIGRDAHWIISDEEVWGSDPLDVRARNAATSLLADDTNATTYGQTRAQLVECERETLLVEVIRPLPLNVGLFGAGHVGRALVNVLADVPCRVTWVDSRGDEFPQRVPANVDVRVTDVPRYEVDSAAPDSFYLVMTHSHGLDLEICEAVLKRDFAYLGLIGSKSKRRRFEKRLAHRGVSSDTIARLICPIGIDTVTGKHPAAIAIAIAAEVLQEYELRAQVATGAPAVAERR